MTTPLVYEKNAHGGVFLSLMLTFVNYAPKKL